MKVGRTGYRVFDFTGNTMEEAEMVMTAWTRVPFPLQDSPMNRFVLIKMPDGSQGMYVLIHHFISDAQSMILFMKDVIELYCNTMYEGVEYPKDMQTTLQDIIDEYNRKAPLYKRIVKLKIRETEFEKNTTKKIKRF